MSFHSDFASLARHGSLPYYCNCPPLTAPPLRAATADTEIPFRSPLRRSPVETSPSPHGRVDVDGLRKTVAVGIVGINDDDPGIVARALQPPQCIIRVDDRSICRASTGSA